MVSKKILRLQRTDDKLQPRNRSKYETPGHSLSKYVVQIQIFRRERKEKKWKKVEFTITEQEEVAPLYTVQTQPEEFKIS